MRRVTAISGFKVKGPAAFLLEMDGRRLLLDIGQGPDDRARPDLSGIGPVDAILISHAHADHVGSLDLAGLVGDPPIYASDPVRALAPEPALAGARALPRTGRIEIAGLSVETGGAGHAPGAVWMRIGGERGLLYTGDVSDESVLYANEEPPRADALVFDASYGLYDTPLAEGLAALLDAARRRPLLLPAPAGGRGLEMGILFREAGAEVFLCPAHRAVGETLLAHAPWLASGARGRLEALLAGAAPIEAAFEPRGIMIAAKPNADAGVAAELVKRWRDERAVDIVFTGHLSRGTPASALTGSGRARFLRWNVHPRLSTVRRLLERVRPAVAMAAFVAPEGVADLAAACPETNFADTARIDW